MRLAAAAPQTGAWSDLRLRVASALILAPLALAAIWFGGVAWIVLLVIGFAGLAVEWVRLCVRPVFTAGGAAVPLAVLAAGGLAVAGQTGAAVLLIVCAALPMAWLGRAGGGRALAWGVPYLAAALVALVWLRGENEIGRANLMFLVLVVWTTDIGAYVAGRLLGGPKLAPRISPGKTWSGAAGGLAAAMLLPAALVGLMVGGWRPEAVLVAALLSVVAQGGDLLESAIKRHFGVKDSGQLIPGHGGLLDRLDGLLTAAPAAALLAAVAGRGVLL